VARAPGWEECRATRELLRTPESQVLLGELRAAPLETFQNMPQIFAILRTFIIYVDKRYMPYE
jgi:hypothetical protein